MKPEYRSREALDQVTDRAAQIRALPPAVQNREAAVLVRCPKRALVLRVFRLRSGELLALPAAGRGLLRSRWFVVPSDTPTPQNVTAGRCRCCTRGLHLVSAEKINAAVRAGKRTITLRAVP